MAHQGLTSDEAGRGRPYCVAPPGRADLVRWPDAFGTRFLVTCDVEEEFDWRQPLDRTRRATTAMVGFPAAHARFAERGVGLACMIDHPIATDRRAVDILRAVIEDGHSSIGTQLHSWVNPPFDEAVTPANSYAGNLPEALEAAKLDVLTDAIATAFARRPIAYRAGRYGIGENTLRLLARRGYRIDSSMRAHYDYSGGGGPDFTRIGPAAFRREGMIELPLTTVFTGRLRRAALPLYGAAGRIPHGRGLIARATLVNRVSLTPEDMPIAEALEAVDVAIGKGARLLVFSFHSPSLMPGHTPYVRDAADLARFWSWWDRMLDRLDRLGVRAASMDQIIAAADQMADI